MSIDDIKKVIQDELTKNGKTIGSDFHFGEYLDLPNSKGVFSYYGNNWFVYEIDERNIKSISGPFTEKEIIYAIALLLHESKRFETHKFGADGLQKYIHNHFRNLEEVNRYLELGEGI